jgi:hypothetical protein
MGRIRTIKPEFFRHEDLFDAEVETGLPLRIAFIGLWTVCDKEGRFEWRPRSLKMDVLPYDDVDFSRVLHALATRGFIVRYEVGGKEYGCVPSFSRHQIINHRETPSKLPEPPQAPENATELTPAPRVDDASSTRHGYARGEREGEREREDIGGGGDAGASDPPTHRESLIAAMGVDPSRPIVTTGGKSLGGAADMLEARRWAELGLSEAEQIAVIAEAMARKRDGPPMSFKYFTPAMQRFAADKASAETPLTPINGETHDPSIARSAQPAKGRQNRVDPALEQIARLAGLGAAPGYGGG